MVLAVAAALLAVLVLRQTSTAEGRRSLATIAGVAFGIRVLAVAVIYLIAVRVHSEGTWLNDEASFYLAAQALLPAPLTTNLPQGLGHLAGNSYLGLITAISVALGGLDTVAFRLTNAMFGAMVAVLAALVAQHLFGRRAGLIAGLLVGLWPTLVLWSATMLRDMLAGFVVVCVWWALIERERLGRVRVVCIVALAVALVTGLRPYLAGGLVAGILAWTLYPLLARQSRKRLVVTGVLATAVVAGLALQQARHIDQAAHELAYRQLSTRMETLGRLYHDPVPGTPPQEPPFGPGAAVAYIEPTSGSLLTGLVQVPVGPGLVSVAFTDQSIRTLAISDLTQLQSAALSPLLLLLLQSLEPGVLSFVTGLSSTSDSTSLAWTADALAWDVLFAIAVVGGVRGRVSPRTWLVPVFVVLATAGALIAIPGAPGNDDRHRSSQTVPLLAVFAAGALASLRFPRAAAGGAVTSARTSPATAPAPAASRTRSAR